MFTTSRRHPLLRALLVASLLPSLALSQTIMEQSTVTASDGGGGGLDFGNAVAIDGDTLVVGAPNAFNAGGTASGAAYVYVRSGAVWAEQQKLTAAVGTGGDYFGISVAIDGDTIAVGARWTDRSGFLNNGSAYVFTRTAGVWSEQGELVPSDPEDNAWAGYSVDVDGDTVILGAPFKLEFAGFAQGAAYVFTRTAGVWSEQQKLVAIDGGGGDFYGWSVGVSGNTVAIGSEFDDPNGSNSGSAYVYTRAGSNWTLQQQLDASDGQPDDQFGVSIDIDQDTIIVGAIQAPFMAPCCTGAAYVYTRSGGSWTEQQKLTASDGAADDNFGNAVAVDGDRAVVGAFKADPSAADAGAGYVFERSAGVWSQTNKLVSSAGAAGDWLGDSVAISGSTIPAGATPAERVDVFELNPSLGGLFCFGVSCPCANNDPSAGCANSSGVGAFANVTGGTTSVMADDLVLTAIQCPRNNSGLWFMGGTTFPAVLVDDGLSCTGGLFRFLPGLVDGSGNFSITGIVAQAPMGQISAGDTRYFTAWTRDVLCGPPPAPCPSPCGLNSNLSNGVSVVFTP